MGAVTVPSMPLCILSTAIHYMAVGPYLAIQIQLFMANDGHKSPSLVYLPIGAHLICQSGLALLANWAYLICGQGAICHAQALPLALIISWFSLIILHSVFHSFILARPLALKYSSLSSQTSLVLWLDHHVRSSWGSQGSGILGKITKMDFREGLFPEGKSVT